MSIHMGFYVTGNHSVISWYFFIVIILCPNYKSYAGLVCPWLQYSFSALVAISTVPDVHLSGLQPWGIALPFSWRSVSVDWTAKVYFLTDSLFFRLGFFFCFQNGRVLPHQILPLPISQLFCWTKKKWKRHSSIEAFFYPWPGEWIMARLSI